MGLVSKIAVGVWFSFVAVVLGLVIASAVDLRKQRKHLEESRKEGQEWLDRARRSGL